MRKLLRRMQVLVVASSLGGSAMVLEGCDPSARTTVLSGVEAAATGLFTTFIQAFFQTIATQDDEEVDTVKVIDLSQMQPLC